MLWGAKVKNDNETDLVRVGGSTYGHGLKAGRFIKDANGVVLGSDDPSNNHVWRVRSDWASGNLTDDAANYFGVDVGAVSDDQIMDVKLQYEYDWIHWPAAWGAPYKEMNNTAGYQPASWDSTSNSWTNGDIPGYPGSNQTMWTIANDVPLVCLLYTSDAADEP